MEKRFTSTWMCIVIIRNCRKDADDGWSSSLIPELLRLPLHTFFIPLRNIAMRNSWNNGIHRSYIHTIIYWYTDSSTCINSILMGCVDRFCYYVEDEMMRRKTRRTDSQRKLAPPTLKLILRTCPMYVLHTYMYRHVRFNTKTTGKYYIALYIHITWWRCKAQLQR